MFTQFTLDFLKIVCLISVSPAILRNADKITTAEKDKQLSLFSACLFCIYSASTFLLNIWQFLCFLCVVFHIATEEIAGVKRKKKKKLHTGKYELLLNPKNSVHSEELINKLNNILWKQTLTHKHKTRNENLGVMENHNINMSQQSNAVPKNKQNPDF